MRIYTMSTPGISQRTNCYLFISLNIIFCAKKVFIPSCFQSLKILMTTKQLLCQLTPSVPRGFPWTSKIIWR